MPKGVYERKPHGRISKETIFEFVKFTFREDIARELETAKYPHKLAVELFFNESGITVRPETAYKQRGKWRMVNGVVVKIK